jgi:hypothetical protein
VSKFDTSDLVGITIGFIFMLSVFALFWTGWAGIALLFLTIFVVCVFTGMRYYAGHVKSVTDTVTAIEQRAASALSSVEGLAGQAYDAAQSEARDVWKRTQDALAGKTPNG